jgi:hypothetical protein
MVTAYKNPVRKFNGVSFYSMSNQTTAARLFWNDEEMIGYAHGREVTTGYNLIRKRPAKTRHRKTLDNPAGRA